jgi:uncharacterized membrane protein (Fun14 family)
MTGLQLYYFYNIYNIMYILRKNYSLCIGINILTIGSNNTYIVIGLYKMKLFLCIVASIIDIYSYVLTFLTSNLVIAYDTNRLFSIL